MKELKPDEGLRLFDIHWRTNTAGPSPNNNERIEVFLLGCDKAANGNPCQGCFNSVTWNKDKALWSWDPIELADMINENCDPNNKYLTIGGGEPTDQIDNLIPFTKRLKEHGFHIMMYTWRNVYKLLQEIEPLDNGCFGVLDGYEDIDHLKAKELFKYLDIVVDGEFVQAECLYQQELGDGMLSSIGSGNQRIWDIKAMNNNESFVGRFQMKDLVGLYIKPDTNDLVYITKK